MGTLKAGTVSHALLQSQLLHECLNDAVWGERGNASVQVKDGAFSVDSCHGHGEEQKAVVCSKKRTFQIGQLIGGQWEGETYNMAAGAANAPASAKSAFRCLLLYQRHTD